MSGDGFTRVPTRKPPGPFAWRCPNCSSREPFKADGGLWNGAQATCCRICSYAAKAKTCTRYGTNGKNGGKWAPWDDNNPPKPPNKPAAPAPRVPGQTPDVVKKRATAAEKKNAALEKENKQLKEAAKQTGGAPAATAAPAPGAGTTPIDTIASGSSQADTLKADITAIDAKI